MRDASLDMTRSLPTIGLLAALVAAGAACSDLHPPDIPEGGAVVTFAFPPSQVTMEVLILHEPTLVAAEERVATGAGPTLPIGPIVRGAGIDPRYPFHYVYDEIRLTDAAIELCDGAPMRTPEEVDEFFLNSTGDPGATRATWCPWGAVAIAVERR